MSKIEFRTLEEIERQLSPNEKDFIQAQSEIAHQSRLTIHKIAVKECDNWERLRHKVPISLFEFDKQIDDAINNLVMLSNIITINNDSWLDPEYTPKKLPNLEY